MSNGLPTPEVGRVVWFYPGETEAKEGWVLPKHGMPLAATIAGVVNDVLVNLSVFDFHGVQRGRTDVPLVTGDILASSFGYARWMPYQIEQAKRQADKVEAAVRPPMPDPYLRKNCIEMALAIVVQGSSPAEILTMAQEFEQHILGRPINPPTKEKA